ncbi:MAG TPA: hypothetical protein VN436_02345 [Holophaga sp.]|nr:hypothetical protein [Holophaga sp.]
MFLRRMTVFVMAAILLLGCGNKPSESVPLSAPPTAKEPVEILKNLQYLGTRKDLKQISVIAVTDLNMAYAGACRIHRHAGELGLVLGDQDIMDLGATDLRTKGYLAPGVSRFDYLEAKRTGKSFPWMAKLDPAKLDRLPERDTLPDGRPNPEYQELKNGYATPALAAGIYRIVSGVPAAMWPQLAVLTSKPDPGSTGARTVILGFKDAPVLQVSVAKNLSGGYGISNLVLEQPTKHLLAMLDGKK